MQHFVFTNPKDHFEEIQSSFLEFLSLVELYQDQPKQIDSNFLAILYNLSHVIYHFDMKEKFIEILFNFLETHPESLPSDVRVSFIQSLIVLHNKNAFSTEKAIQKFFPLNRINDKTVRKIIFGHFINNLQGNQSKSIKKEIQKFVNHDNQRISTIALRLIIDLFYKTNQEDFETINFIARLIETKNFDKFYLINHIVSFFLDPFTPEEVDEGELDELLAKAQNAKKVNAKTNKSEKKINQIIKKKKSIFHENPIRLLDLIENPHKFVLHLFSFLSRPETSKNFKTRDSQLRALELLSKIIAHFQLNFDEFLKYITKFVRPNYENVTKMLVICASAVHPQTTPDQLTELLRIIADRFIVDNLDEEIRIVGLNCVREICARNCHGMTESMLSDLTLEKKSDIKGVVVAARSLINLFREVQPDLLSKKDRGKPNDKEGPVIGAVFGEVKEDFDEELLEESLAPSKKIWKSTREEKIEMAKSGKPAEHKHRDWKEGKTGGFSDKDKLKSKDFILTRFRKDSSLQKNKNKKSIDIRRIKREGIHKSNINK